MAITSSTLTTLGSLDPYGLGSSGTSNPVTAASNPAAVAQAVELSSEASVIVTLGGGSSANSGLTYNAAGLFDSIVNAGSSAGTSTDLTQNQASQSYYQGVLGSIVTPGTTSGIYDGSGVFAGEGLSSQLSLLLKSQPDLTGSIVEDIVNQNVVGGLISTMA
ncbi:hypothetical protein [Herbaspirillum huttiense]|uniref:Uncharacterized protein n=1 Tax=Herbaspirillum huttiense subsp. lycopersici TaxID=3074428 RepID=A0ABU2ESD2_9BURK|nr:hypothetical protein [Herbaspirillum huttiense]MDR9851084.1 hypothetical protein [Herbaspirillum huttiense SE1]